MAEVKWIKIATDVFDDQKIRMIETMPEGDAIIVIWFKLLMLAGKVNDGGFIYFTKDIPYTDQMLATYFNKPLSIVQLALNTFIKFQMIEIVDDLIFVSNWEKHQNIEGMEKIKEQNRLRKQRQREREKQLLENGHVTSRDSHATDIDKEEDKNKRKNIYCVHFEKVWDIYLKKKDKAMAYKAYNARLNDGYSEDELYQATVKYMDECKQEHRLEKYIKNASTFFGPSTPFVDYLPKGPIVTKSQAKEWGYQIYDESQMLIAPYYGFPREWFEGEELIKERVKPIIWSKPIPSGEREIDVSAEDLIAEYESRRRVANGKSNIFEYPGGHKND